MRANFRHDKAIDNMYNTWASGAASQAHPAMTMCRLGMEDAPCMLPLCASHALVASMLVPAECVRYDKIVRTIDRRKYPSFEHVPSTHSMA